MAQLALPRALFAQMKLGLYGKRLQPPLHRLQTKLVRRVGVHTREPKVHTAGIRREGSRWARRRLHSFR